MGFPGTCDRCGSPQVWTFHAGDVWVACPKLCLDDQVDMFGRNPPLMALCSEAEGVAELSEREGVVPLEGGAARTSVAKNEGPGDLPPGFLRNLWEGEVNEDG